MDMSLVKVLIDCLYMQRLTYEAVCNDEKQKDPLCLSHPHQTTLPRFLHIHGYVEVQYSSSNCRSIQASHTAHHRD